MNVRTCGQAFWAAALLLVLADFNSAQAQTAASENAPAVEASEPETPEALAGRQAVLLKDVIANPSDLDIALEYALVSSLLGDYEAAVGTFERILVFAPDLARAKLELGVLYFRLGSYGAAQYYLEQAANSPNAPEDVRATAENYLVAVVKYQDPASFRAVVMTGVRYQSNANAAPGNRRVSVNGGTVVLDDTSVGQADVNAFVAGQIGASYDLGTQGDLLEAELTVYAARFADIVRLDTALAELTFGPTLNLERFEIENSILGLYAIAAGVRLNHANYSGAFGLGAHLVSEITPSLLFDAKVEWRRRLYNDTAEYTTVSDLNGHEVRLAATLSRTMNEALTLRSLVLAQVNDGAQTWTTSWELGGGLGASYGFSSPIERLPLDWSLDVEAGYVYREYQGPDPSVSTSETEFDHEAWLRTGLSVPLRRDVALGVSGELRRRTSNYSLSDYTNASALVSLSKAF